MYSKLRMFEGVEIRWEGVNWGGEDRGGGGGGGGEVENDGYFDLRGPIFLNVRITCSGPKTF